MTLVQRNVEQEGETVDPLIDDLSEACRLLTDLPYGKLQIRRNLITANMDPP